MQPNSRHGLKPLGNSSFVGSCPVLNFLASTLYASPGLLPNPSSILLMPAFHSSCMMLEDMSNVSLSSAVLVPWLLYSWHNLILEGSMKYRVHRIHVEKETAQEKLQGFLNQLDGEILAIVPYISPTFRMMGATSKVDFLLIVEKTD
jgi:hypothetical protein